jgi:hypothetical protein
MNFNSQSNTILNDEIEKKNQLKIIITKSIKLTCQTRDPGHETWPTQKKKQIQC